MLILSSKTYEFGKKLTQILLPALTALYVGLAGLWDLPEPEKVAGTIATVNAFLGVVLGISSSTFKKVNEMDAGDVVVEENGEGGHVVTLDLSKNPEALMTKNSLTFKVVRK